MSVKESIVRAFLKLNIFARTPEVEESGFISKEELKRKIAEEVINSKEYHKWKDKKGK